MRPFAISYCIFASSATLQSRPELSAEEVLEAFFPSGEEPPYTEVRTTTTTTTTTTTSAITKKLLGQLPLQNFPAPEIAGGDTKDESLTFDLSELLTDYEPFRTKDTAQAHENGTFPPHVPLVPRGMARSLAKELTAQTVEGHEIDFGSVLEAFSHARPLQKLPYRSDLGSRRGITLLVDRNIGMMPFARDVDELTAAFGDLFGSTRFRFTDLRKEGESDFTALVSADRNRALVIVSDGFALCAERGLPAPSSRAWRSLFKQAWRLEMPVFFISPGSTRSGEVAQPSRACRDAIVSGGVYVAPLDFGLSGQVVRRVQRHLPLWVSLRDPVWDNNRIPNGKRNDRRRSQARAVRLLLRLLTRVGDGEPRILRAMRLVLGAPQKLYAMSVWPAWIRPPGNPASSHLRPIPEVSTLTEYRSWAEPFFTTRETRWTYDVAKIADRLTQYEADAEKVKEHLKLAREVMVRLRAVLPVNYLLADEILLSRETSLDGAAARQRMAALSSSENRSAKRISETVIRYVEGQFGLAPPLSNVEAAQKKLQETISVTINLESVVASDDHADVDTPTLHAVESRYALYSGQRILLSARNSRVDAIFEIWSSSGQTSDVHSVTRLPVAIPVDARSHTLVIRQGKRETILGLQSDIAPTQLFKPTMDLAFEANAEVFFDSNEITVGRKVFDAVGLIPKENSEPYLPGRFSESSVDKGLSGKRIVLDGALIAATTPAGHLIINSEDGVQDLPTAVLLPGYENKARRAIVSRSPSAAAVLGHEDLWAISGVRDTVTITRYSGIGTCSLFAGACSDAGVLLAYRRGDGNTDLVLYPHATPVDGDKGSNTPEASSVLYGQIPIHYGFLKGLAINETGYIAAAVLQTDKTVTLHLFAPLTEQTPQAAGARSKFDAAQDLGAKEISPVISDVYLRTWTPFDDGDFEQRVLEDLLFRLPIDRDSVGRASKLLKLKTSLPLERIEEHLGEGSANAGLIWAILNRSPSRFITSELARGADANLRLPTSALTPLLLACLGEKNTDTILTLLEHGADPNFCDDWGRSPLYYACFQDDGGHSVETLLIAGGDPSLYGSYGNIKIGCLAPALFPREGDENYPRVIIQKLIDGGARFEHRGNTTGQNCLIPASARGDLDFIQQAITAGNDLHGTDENGWTALGAAADRGHVDAINLLVSSGADPNTGGTNLNPLYNAVRGGHLSAVVALLKLGADPNAGDPPSDYPLSAKDVEPGLPPETARAIATELLEAGLNADRPDKPPLLRIADTKELCCEQRAFLEAIRGLGQPVGLLNTLRVLKDFFVLGEGIAEVLSLPHPSVNSSDDNGRTALHYAASLPGKGDGVPVWQTLLRLGADPMLTDKNGNLPIHIAAATDQLAIVNALAAASPHSLAHRNSKGLTPLDISNANGNDELERALSLKHEATVPIGQTIGFTPNPPTKREISHLQHLVWPLSWREATLGEDTIRTSLEFDRSDMSFKHVGRWSAVLRRSALLPYSKKVRLVETWFRGDNERIGVSAEVCNRLGRHLFYVDGKSKQIHEFNSSNTLNIDGEKEARNYLSFFCNAVHGEDGPFKILTKVEDVPSASPLPDSLHQDIRESLKHATFVSEGGNTWRAQQTVLYSHAIFETTFRIQASGTVEMLDDNPIAVDLPTYAFECTGGLTYLALTET